MDPKDDNSLPVKGISHTRSSRVVFFPPVQDTLQVMRDLSRGKVIAEIPFKVVKKFDGPQIPHKKPSAKPSVPSQLQTSLRIQ